VSGHAATPHLERANAAEVEVSRLKTLVQQQADRIAWLEGEVAGWRIKLAAAQKATQRLSVLLGEAGDFAEKRAEENQQLRDALEAGADDATTLAAAAMIARAALDGTP
jgi:chromosome segregation ATPase